MTIDALQDLKVVSANPAATIAVWLTVAGDQNGATIDTLGYASVTFVFGFGGYSSGAANFFLDESDDGTTWTAVPVASLRNRSATAAATAGLLGTIVTANGKAIHVGVLTQKRYYRMRQGNSSTPTGSGSAMAILANGTNRPAALTAW